MRQNVMCQIYDIIINTHSTLPVMFTKLNNQATH